MLSAPNQSYGLEIQRYHSFERNVSRLVEKMYKNIATPFLERHETNSISETTKATFGPDIVIDINMLL